MNLLKLTSSGPAFLIFILAHFLQLKLGLAHGFESTRHRQQMMPFDEVTEESVRRFGETLQRYFNNLSGYLNVSKGFDDVYKKAIKPSPQTTKLADIRNLADTAKRRLEGLFAQRIRALRNLVAASEEFAFGLTTPDESLDLNPNANLTYVDLKNSNSTQGLNPLKVSGVHLPVDLYEGDAVAQRDINWTHALTSTFKQNHNGYGEPTRQFVALASGVTRLYPANPWRLDPEKFTIDLFDPRYRPWYIHAITSPKDILIMMDYSGSVHGRTLRLMKMTILFLMSTLSSNDYINIVWYNNKVGEALKLFPHFVQATTRNKLILQRRLNMIENQNEADFKSALKYALQRFEEMDNLTETNSNFSDKNYGSGGHKMILVMTDASEGYHNSAYKLFTYQHSAERNVSVRFFGIAMGTWTGDIFPLQVMACVNKGYYGKIGNLEAIKIEASAYIPVLGRSRALHLQTTPIDERDVVFTGPYMDAQGYGATLTLSMPLIDTMYNAVRNSAKTNQSFIGVAGIDMKISELKDQIPQSDLGADGYIFMIDQNGNLLFHPDYKFPLSDLYAIRRTACSAVYKQDKTKKNMRTIFGETTEHVLQQMGLADSIASKDLLDVETPSTDIDMMRRDMIEQNCSLRRIFDTDQVVLLDKNHAKTVKRVYACRPIDGTIFSVGISMPESLSVEDTNLPAFELYTGKLAENNLVEVLISSGTYCSKDFNALEIRQRAPFLDSLVHRSNTGEKPKEKEIICLSHRHDIATSRLLNDINATRVWLESFWEGRLKEMFAAGTSSILVSSQRLHLDDDTEDYHGDDDDDALGLYKTFVSFNDSCLPFKDMQLDGSIPSLAFVQTTGGLTALFPKCLRNVPQDLLQDMQQSGFYRYAREEPHRLLFSPDDTTKSDYYVTQAINVADSVKAVVGIRLSLYRLLSLWRNESDQEYAMFTSSPEKLDTNLRSCWNQKNVTCYIMDDTGNVLSSTPQFWTPEVMFIGQLDPQLTSFLINHNYLSVYEWTNFTDYNGECPLPSEGHFINAGMRLIFWFSVLSTSSNLFAQIASFAAASMELPNDEPICDYLPAARIESCVLRRHLYKVNLNRPLHYQLPAIGHCKRNFVILPIPETNLFLVQTELPCHCTSRKSSKCPQPLSNAPTRIDEAEEIRIWYRRRRPTEESIFRVEEDSQQCRASIPAFSAATILFTSFSLVHSGAYLFFL